MTDIETKLILARIEANWTPFKNSEAAVTLWADRFKSDPYPLVLEAVNILIDTDLGGFRPTIGQVKAANAAHGIPHTALLLPQFFFVGNVAELAASALGEGGAIGRNAVGRGLQQFFQTAEGIVFQHLYQADAANIPPSGAGDKDGHAVDMGNAGALGGIALNGGGMNLIFHQRHRRTPLHRNRGDPNGPPGIG